MSFEMHFWEASMLGHGAGIGYTGPGGAPLTISVWWRGRKKIKSKDLAKCLRGTSTVASVLST